MTVSPTVRGCCRFSGFTPIGGKNLFEAATAYPLRVLPSPGGSTKGRRSAIRQAGCGIVTGGEVSLREFHVKHLIIPDWPAPPRVRALQTTRSGGVSAAPYASLNLGDHVGDAPLAVARNRRLLEPLLPGEPVWLEQVHGTSVVDAASAGCLPQADACVSSRAGAVCVVMTADCLPVLLCDERGGVVGAAHAGWRGLCEGIIEHTVHAMKVRPASLMAWLGPAIGARAFEVGDEVRAAFVAKQAETTGAFIPSTPVSHHVKGGKWLADIYLLARQRLNSLGVTRIYGGSLCTFSDRERFFSYRRDGTTGRMGTFIWLE